MSILEQVRRVRDILAKEEATVELNAVAAKLGAILKSNVYMAANDGTIRASYCGRGHDCTKGRPGRELNPQFQQRVAFIFQPVINLPLETCLFREGDCFPPDLLVAIYPLQLGGEKVGNLFLTRKGKKYTGEELVLLETAALVTSVLLDRKEPGKDRRESTLLNVKIALDSLSYSELVAIRNVFKELGGEEGFLVASKVADRIGITRSVIVNAMRKLESAGVVESRSLGMKGTYIKVKNPDFLAELSRRGK